MRRKLMLAVVLAVLLPLVLFSIFLDRQISGRLTQQVVEEALLAQARGLAEDVDRYVDDRWTDLEFFSQGRSVLATLSMYHRERRQQRADADGDEPELPVVPFGPEYVEGVRTGAISFGGLAVDADARMELSEEFSHHVFLKPQFDLLVLLDEEAEVVASNVRDHRDRDLPLALLERVYAYPFESDPAVVAALGGAWGVHDHHASPLGTHGDAEDPAEHRHVAFAMPVLFHDGAGGEELEGVLWALLNWSYVQALLEGPAVKDTFRGLLPDPSRQPSPYAWIWGADADTILAHPNRALLGESLSQDLGLAQMRDDVLDSASGWGLFRRYEFGGQRKSAAFHRTAPATKLGFDWVVGVGIDDSDIYAKASELRSILFVGTALAVAVVLLWAVYVSSRMTAPIVELQRFAGRVADGDWDARNDVRTRDEVGLLARDLNSMAERLGEQRDQLVAAEKDAAWKEMARQIAHDIKNPLTPIQLSLDLLERARREGAPGADAILERTVELMRNQVAHLREIAGEFHEFTGGRPAVPEEFDLAELTREVLDLHRAWAEEGAIELDVALDPARVHADPGKLRRVLVNLVTNAFQAMPDGGRLEARVGVEGGFAVVRLRDTGSGLAPEARERLFEPYFTTKSEGTGLGLAISRRSVEEAGGTIALEPAASGAGSVASVRLPLVGKGA